MTALWIVIVVAVLVVVMVAATMAVRKRRTAALRERFGPEYDRTVAASEDPRTAEAELRDRQRQRQQLDIKPLSEESRARYAGEWRGIQEHFVDQPLAATNEADDLIGRVMQERGYPMQDFEAQSDLVSVDHPEVAENYRVAHGIQQRAQNEQVSTEDLREALLRYRSLFTGLLGGDQDADPEPVSVPDRPEHPQDSSTTPVDVEAADDTR